MKANELRIGNWVYKMELDLTDTKYYFLPNEVDYHILFDVIKGDKERVQPIPITEKWLLKFGFEFYRDAASKPLQNSIFSGIIHLYFVNTLDDWEFSIGDYDDITRVKYVHQLQNLYFALTGEELTIEK